LVGCRKECICRHREDREGREEIYQVVRVCAIGIRRYVKIKAAANPYLPEYAGYFWRRRHVKESKLFPAMSAREYRAMAIA
jgi:hypothetical protein